MAFFSVILDDEFNHDNFVRLISSRNDDDRFETQIAYDPYGGYSKILKNSFRITQLHARSVKSTINQNEVPAHICKVEPL
jgi:hypothetical protein